MITRIRSLAVATLVTAAAVAVAVPSASADPGFLPSPKSGATVAHVALNGRHGFLNVTLSVGPGDRIVGFTAQIPADGGSWQLLSPRTLSSPPLVCSAGAGPALDDTCITGDNSDLAEGTYQIALPVTRLTGPTDGFDGSIDLIRPGVYEGDPNTVWAADTFPVVDRAKDDQSTAEVRELDITNDGSWELSTGWISLLIEIPADAKVTGVYLDLPQTSGTGWTVQDLALASGIDCDADADYPAVPSMYVASCHDYLTKQEVWPAGQYLLTLHVGAIGLSAATGTVQLRQLGGAPYPVDTFPLREDDGAF